MNAFILDNSINSRSDLGLRITQPPVIPISKRIVDSIPVDGREGSLTLDSELKTCYFGNVAQNQNMQGDFPVFEVGSNTITLGSGITKIEIEGRWRHI